MVALMATVTLCSPPSARVYIQRRWGEDASGYSKVRVSDALHTVILVPPSTSTEWVREQASEIAVHRATLARVCGRSGFWGAYSRLLASSARPTLIRFLIAGTVRGTVLRTSACIDRVRLHRTYRRDVSCEWSYWCLEHWSLRRIQPVLKICDILLLFTDYVSTDTHMHIHIVAYVTIVFWIKLKLKILISLTCITRS
jgi:hypothetical protein